MGGVTCGSAIVCLRVRCARTHKANEQEAVLMKKGWGWTERKIYTSRQSVGFAVEMIHLDLKKKKKCD